MHKKKQPNKIKSFIIKINTNKYNICVAIMTDNPKKITIWLNEIRDTFSYIISNTISRKLCIYENKFIHFIKQNNLLCCTYY